MRFAPALYVALSLACALPAMASKGDLELQCSAVAPVPTRDARQEVKSQWTNFKLIQGHPVQDLSGKPSPLEDLGMKRKGHSRFRVFRGEAKYWVPSSAFELVPGQATSVYFWRGKQKFAYDCVKN